MKILKLTGIFLGIILLIGILMGIFAITFINPAHFKSLIIAEVMKSTGRQVSIDGNLSWTIFPQLGIKIDQIRLSNPHGFQSSSFVEIDHALMTVNIRPLIYKKIESNGIKLEGVRIIFIKKANGAVNWEFKANSTPSFHGKTITPSPAQTANLPLGVLISSLDISQAEISWIDEQKHQLMTLDHVALHMKDINLTKPFPIKASFHFSLNQPAIDGQAEINSLFSINLERSGYGFQEATFSADFKENNKLRHFKATGDMMVTMAEALEMHGNLKMPTFETNNLKMTNVIAPIDYQKGILKLSPMTANFYQGQLQTDASINFNKITPDIFLHLKLTQIDSASLLQAVGQKKLNFEGLGDIDLQLSSVGNTHQTFIKNLNGKGRFDLKKGLLKGVDVSYLIERARGFFQMQNQAKSDQHQTEFSHLTGTISIQDGVLSINDLLIKSNSFTTTGRGHIDLINNEIDYGLKAVVLSDPENQADPLYGISLPIKIRGPLRNPSIRLDLSALAEMQVIQQIKKWHAHKHKSKNLDQLKKSIPEEANALLKNIFGE